MHISSLLYDCMTQHAIPKKRVKFTMCTKVRDKNAAWLKKYR